MKVISAFVVTAGGSLALHWLLVQFKILPFVLKALDKLFPIHIIGLNFHPLPRSVRFTDKALFNIPISEMLLLTKNKTKHCILWLSRLNDFLNNQ